MNRSCGLSRAGPRTCYRSNSTYPGGVCFCRSTRYKAAREHFRSTVAPSISFGALPFKQRATRLSLVAALTESAELPLGTTAPAFELLEPLTGKMVSSSEFKGASALLIIFMCNHCPFVKHLKEAFIQLANDYQPKGVQLVGISSNSTQTHPQDGPENMAEDAKQNGYPFPYLYDESQAVAKQYQAACTPEFFLFDASLNLQYHGQFDSSRPSNDAPVTGEDIRRALDSLLRGEEPAVKVKPSIGCNIKWHPGNEPAYA